MKDASIYPVLVALCIYQGSIELKVPNNLPIAVYATSSAQATYITNDGISSVLKYTATSLDHIRNPA